MSQRVLLKPTQLTEDEREFQREVRAYLDERLPAGSYPISLGMPGLSDPEFSRDLGGQGWLGMALSPQYGGGGRTAVERLIVVEELLARGAPVSYHWVADRQSGPLIQRFGTEQQKAKYLPGIARGELSFSIGMSEPDAGSDLAAVSSRAERCDEGWRINGTKIWTSGAADATQILCLFRTSPDRYGGLTQFIIDTDTPGLTVTPIAFIDGTRHFCEVVFDEVVVGDDQRLGNEGDGWMQNTTELVLERGGVDRWMSMVVIVERWARTIEPNDAIALADLGVMTARLRALRALSLSIARLVDEGESPATEAAMVKELGTRVEQDCVEMVARHFTRPPEITSGDELESLVARALLVGPSWSIRGGTNEILRSIVAKGLAST